ncbi:MAG: SRPBCC domain-containing protein [Myxococcales bacterium]|nr:SRPBCC domain-containing protein [Myxococcales bacterium]
MDGVERWIATGSAVVTFSVLLSAVGVYAYGRSLPADSVVTVQATLPEPPQHVWQLLGDPSRRTEWRPKVERVGRIDDREGLPVWRELDASGDRFDFVVLESVPDRRLVIEVASPEQIGMTGRWIWTLAPDAAGTTLTLEESTAIDNPLWRGLDRLVRHPTQRAQTEVDLLAAHLRL